ncbi:hypothetical protein [Methanoculleus thermophilus]|uniref:hypothetical protein n=1 Tax=Methanoculleus thermophilus TaxID=2200 RepID=UPI000B0DE3E8|nr:hypothetical protein [Methanoculleus thermophilus]
MNYDTVESGIEAPVRGDAEFRTARHLNGGCPVGLVARPITYNMDEVGWGTKGDG